MNLTICTTLQLSPSNVDYIYFRKFIIHWYFLNESANATEPVICKNQNGKHINIIVTS